MYSKLIRRLNTGGLLLDTVKKHLVVTHSDDDEIIELYRDAAIEHIENTTRRSLPLTEYLFSLDVLEANMELAMPPIRALSQITYHNGTERVLMPESDYSINTNYEWARICINDSLPSGSDVQITALAGYGVLSTPSAFPYTFPIILGSVGDDMPLPSPLKLAALMLIAHWYENREAVTMGSEGKPVPYSVESLLFKFRNYKV